MEQTSPGVFNYFLDIYFVLNISPCDCANKPWARYSKLLLSQTRTRSDGVPGRPTDAEIVERWTDSNHRKRQKWIPIIRNSE